MWRKCDLHRHTSTDDGAGPTWDPDEFVRWCLADGLDVVAITDHNRVDRIPEVIEASKPTHLAVLPGIEIATERGDVVILAMSPEGAAELDAFAKRIGAVANDVQNFDEVMQAWGSDASDLSGRRYRESLIMIGAHTDQPGSMLGPAQTGTAENQVQLAAQLDAIEVTSESTRKEWTSSAGIKQTGRSLNIIQSSDAHWNQTHSGRATWLYLEELTCEAVRQALATPESSIRFSVPTESTSYWIRSMEISGGNYDGLKLEFSPRSNAIIGPPSSGKSLIIDCLRFVFSSDCRIDAVAQHSKARLTAQLGEGASVSVTVVADGENHHFLRTWGAGSGESPPFIPVIFSQNELQARAMDEHLSMDLLDLHCPDSPTLLAEIERLGGQVVEAIVGIKPSTEHRRELARQLENPVDGMAATDRSLAELTGTEDAAKIANDLSRAAAWRDSVAEVAVTWRAGLEAPPGPDIPASPKRDGSVDLSSAIPHAALSEAIQQFSTDVDAAADRVVDAFKAAIDATSAELDGLIAEHPWSAPTDGIDDPEKQAARITSLRTRQNELKKIKDQFDVEEDSISTQVDKIIGMLRDLNQRFTDLGKARKDGAKEVNKSMNTFAARIVEDADTSEISNLFRNLARGTNFRSDRVAEVWGKLDRELLLKRIVAHLSRSSDDGAPESDIDAIVSAGLERDRLEELAHACTLRASDRLDLVELATTPPRSYTQQTEGMHALAIKEISFASSDLPAVSDQPEDAVPTQKVFQQMVPAIRTQRAHRQFILASHDANVVVASDVERIFVLDPMQPTSPTVGTLFDGVIRQAALDLLEGGRVAFERRNEHYARR